jgi:hypothetical protein
MSQTIRLGLAILTWAGLAYSILFVRLLPGDYVHSFCGPWGCLPPLQALAAMHGFWILVVVPPAAWAIRACHSRALGAAGLSLITLAVVGIGLVFARESWLWTHCHGVAAWGNYLPQRLFAAAITTTDVPVLQSLAAGIVLSIAAWRKPGRAGR